jgi:hypothetical protein
MEKKEADFKSSLGAHKLKESSKGNKKFTRATDTTSSSSY